jgi:hypothetical protein
MLRRFFPTTIVAAMLLACCDFNAKADTYSQNFNGFANGTSNLGDGSVMAGTANVQNDALELTRDGGASSSASFSIPKMNGSSGGWTATFNLTITDSSGTNDPADGMSFNYGNFALGELGSAEEGMAGVGTVTDNISFEIDTWRNGDAEQGVNIAEKVNGTTNDVAFTNGRILNDGSSVSGAVSIAFDPVNGASFTTTGLLTNANFGNIPVSFAGNDAYHFCLSTRVGGANETLLIDNLVINTVTVTPIETGGPIISEFCADNGDTIEDEDLNSPDWIEIYNGQSSSQNLSGYYLTDDPLDLTKWRIPAITIGGYDYLLIFASGKDRDNPDGLLHASFSLEKDGGYLALVDPDGSTVLSEYTYADQSEDISYGELGSARSRGYLETPTPGWKNGGSQSPEGPAENAQFDRTGGLFSNSTTLTILPTASPSAVVRYTTNNTVPNESSAVYNGTPFNITNTTTIRARVFDPGRLPGEIKSRTLVELHSNVQNFSSALPIIVADSAGTNVDSGSRSFHFTYTVVIDKDPDDGLARMTDPTDFTGRGGMHIRGQSSSGFPKKQYAWETWNNANEDKNVSILGMPGESDWIIHAPYSDKTLMRNVMVYDCARQLWGNNGGVRTRFVELFFNQNGGTVSMSDYRGVYVLMEKIKGGEDRVDVERINNSVTDPELIKGGYIFKKDKEPSSQPWSTSTEGIPLDMHHPQSVNSAQFSYLTGHVNQFEAALHSADFENPETGYSAFIDVLSFIDNHLFVETFKEIDGYRISAYFAKPRYGKIRALPVWDYNLSLGNANYLQGEVPQGWYYTQLSGTNYYWYQRLFQSTEFRLAYWDRFWELRRGAFTTPNLMAKIDAWDAELDQPNASGESAVTRNFNEWNILGSYVWPNAGGYGSRTTHQAEVNWMKNWLTQRMTWIETQSRGTNAGAVARPPSWNQYGGTLPANFNLTMSEPNGWGGANIYFTTNGSDPRVAGNNQGSVTTFFNENTACEALVPSAVNGGSTLSIAQWTNPAPPPNAASWTTGVQGIGYERSGNNTYGPEIGTDLESDMYGINQSAYIRIPFTAAAADLAEITQLTLRMKYDDSFVAYLNGTEVARDAARTPAAPTWNSGANSTHNDTEALTFMDFDITAHAGKLQEGSNLLAVHGLNSGSSSSDALWRCVLVASAGASNSPSPAAQIYSGPLTLNTSAEINARVFDGSKWSPVSQGLFIINAIPASSSNIVVSEFDYHPAQSSTAEINAGYPDRSKFEYIELLNIDPTRSVTLEGAQFTNGITFTFDDSLSPQALVLPPGGHIVVVDNIDAFAFRHNTSGAIVAGAYSGSLSNDGEQVILVNSSANVIKDFTYNDVEPWPVTADGDGFSLVLINPADNPEHSDPLNWRASVKIGGTPGGSGSNGQPFTGNPDDDEDHDGQSAFLEYGLGTDDNDATSRSYPGATVELLSVDGVSDDYIVFEFRKNSAAVGINYSIESAVNLAAWQDATASFVFLSTTDNGDGSTTVRYRSATPTPPIARRFYRLAISG